MKLSYKFFMCILPFFASIDVYNQLSQYVSMSWGMKNDQEDHDTRKELEALHMDSLP